MHVFQHRKFIVYGLEELLQTRNWDLKVDAAYAITVLERKCYSLFIFCGEILMRVIEIDDEWEGWRMCQHICYRCAMCTDEAKMQLVG